MARDARISVFPIPGIYRGATAEVSAMRWWDMNLMRWRGGQLQPIGGWGALAGVNLGGAGRDVLTWHDNAGNRWGAFGTDTQIFVLNFALATLTDITPAGVGPLEPPGAAIGYGLADYGEAAYGTAREPADIGVVDVSAVLGDMWSMDLFGEDLLFLPTQTGTLYRWSPSAPDDLAAPVPGAPTANAAVGVTDERHVVLIGAAGNSRMVAWSDQENPEVWTASVDNLAGDKQLETEGRPMNIKKAAGGMLIWTDNDAHLMRYVGPPYAYGINKIGANCGPVSRRAFSQAGSQTMWMAAQTFWVYDGTLSPVPCAVGDWLFSIINREMVGRIFGAPNAQFAEHWFHIPDEGSSECNRYVAMNYASPGKEWIIGALSRSAADPRQSMQRPVLTTTDGKVMLHEFGWTDDGRPRFSQIFAETGTYALGDGEDQRMAVLQIIQDFTGPADRLGYRFSFWEEPNGPEYDSGTIPITNDSGRTDMGDGFSCRGMRVRIEALSDGPFAVGKTRLRARACGFV